MSSVLSGGTNGSSILTGLTLPILLNQVSVDSGYYTPFDGIVEQKDVVTNFVFSSDTTNPYLFYVYNTSESNKKFLLNSDYTIDWGDGTAIESVSYDYVFVSHLYPLEPKTYDVILKQNNPWGANVITKKITVPYDIVDIDNPNGTIEFISNSGSWSATPINYNYIFDGDSNEQNQDYYSGQDIIISGYTSSRIEELSQYGQNKFLIGVPIIKYGDIFGMIDDIGVGYTGYTIQGVKYYDYSEGVTMYIQNYSGLTSADIDNTIVTKDEFLLGIVDQPQIQTDIFVERGKVSPYENVLRIGEVYNLVDLENYGYGFFTFTNK
jgi:hypothetical protein